MCGKGGERTLGRRPQGAPGATGQRDPQGPANGEEQVPGGGDGEQRLALTRWRKAQCPVGNPGFLLH